MTTHTPGPWKIARVFVCNSPDQYHVVRVSAREQWGQAPLAVCDTIMTAETIVRACNSHDALLEALKLAVDVISSLVENEDGIEEDLAIITNAIAQAEGTVPA